MVAGTTAPGPAMGLAVPARARSGRDFGPELGLLVTRRAPTATRMGLVVPGRENARSGCGAEDAAGAEAAGGATLLAERVAGRRVARVEALPEPRRALLGGPVGPRLGVHARPRPTPGSGRRRPRTPRRAPPRCRPRRGRPARRPTAPRRRRGSRPGAPSSRTARSGGTGPDCWSWRTCCSMPVCCCTWWPISCAITYACAKSPGAPNRLLSSRKKSRSM